MKMVKNLFLLMIFSYSTIGLANNSSIIMYLAKYPSLRLAKPEPDIATLSKKLQQPGYLFKKITKKRITSGAQGVMSMYLGHTNISDQNGEILFPRKHQKPIMNLLVTKSIQPVYILAPSTINNWMLDTHQPAVLYQFKFDKDLKTGLYYVQTSKIPLPEDHMISLDTIIIISDPKNIFVPIGATLSQYSANFILPQIYIKKGFDYSYNTLYTFSIKHYFDTIHAEYKPEELTIAQIIK